jgi:hypothetical protein
VQERDEYEKYEPKPIADQQRFSQAPPENGPR